MAKAGSSPLDQARQRLPPLPVLGLLGAGFGWGEGEGEGFGEDEGTKAALGDGVVLITGEGFGVVRGIVDEAGRGLHRLLEDAAVERFLAITAWSRRT